MSIKIAVYGSLRKGFHNHSLIKNSKFLGEFKTPPTYTMVSLGSFPGLFDEGTTSIVLEVYEIDQATAERVDMLEGYDPKDNPKHNHYNKVMIDTPFGEAGLYLYNDTIRHHLIIGSGDWAEYHQRG